MALKRKQIGYWTEETIILELKPILEELGHFPTQAELYEINRTDLRGAIDQHGGFNHFREKMGHELLHKPSAYWTEETIIAELESIIEELGHFPTANELIRMKKGDLLHAILNNNNFNYYRKLLDFKSLKKSKNFWNEKTIIAELKPIIDKIGHFPTANELIKMNKADLQAQISKRKGFIFFWKLLGINITERQKHQSTMSSYTSKRGLNSEKIVKELITKWCQVHNLVPPKLNVKLTSGNVLEFVCESNLKIGIDVTNTKASKNSAHSTIKKKWKHKEYHLHLDELWIVVFSDVFTDTDYIKFNKQSPCNVKIMSIETFMKELGITIDDNLQLKIDNYSACTFHNKNDLIIPKQGVGKYFKMKPDIRIKS